MTYKQVHLELARLYGRAREHLCAECGSSAQEWAYQHTAGDQELYDPKTKAPYSEALENYLPLCKSCHLRLDKLRMWAEPGRREALSEWNQRRWQDPNYRQTQIERLRTMFKDPEYLLNLSRNSSAYWANEPNRAAAAERTRDNWTAERRAQQSRRNRELWSDPKRRESLAAKQRENWKDPAVYETRVVGFRRRFKCGGCTLVSTAGPLSQHQQRKGHVGRTGMI